MKVLLVILLIFCLILSALYIYNAYAVKTNKAAIDEYIKYQMSIEEKHHTISVDINTDKKDTEPEANVLDL